MLKLMQLYIGHGESPSSVGYQGFGLELEVGGEDVACKVVMVSSLN